VWKKCKEKKEEFGKKKKKKSHYLVTQKRNSTNNNNHAGQRTDRQSKRTDVSRGGLRKRQKRIGYKSILLLLRV